MMLMIMTSDTSLNDGDVSCNHLSFIYVASDAMVPADTRVSDRAGNQCTLQYREMLTLLRSFLTVMYCNCRGIQSAKTKMRECLRVCSSRR